MDTKDFFDQYFNDALSISALCSDLGLSQEDAKLFTYIHVKSANAPEGVECFNHFKDEEVLALEILLGIKKMPVLKDNGHGTEECDKVIQNFSNELSRSIKELDFLASEGCGRESYFRAELMRRLRFHQDPDFRRKKLNLYVTEIFPRIKEYTKDKIYAAFERDRKHNQKIILNFRDSLN
jgi:hypothetical protein